MKYLIFLLFFSSACFHNAWSENPALIPLPQSVKWNHGTFRLSICEAIIIKDASLKKDANSLQRCLSDKTGKHINVVEKRKEGPCIELELGRVETKYGSDEAYRLTIDNKYVKLTANTTHGIFNGLQTLYQLITTDGVIPACVITDSPAFSWRGYMVDVGRNFQSVSQLKEQIEIMAKYKLNIFHFHCTEDIAWRLEIPEYPQLTLAQNMTRNPGLFYSVEDMNDLIQYCKDRYITLIPELDMPGHSQAFTRAFGFNMQSEKGLAVVKNILRSFCSTYGLPYLHIGADEVRITNKNFIPAIESLLDSLHQKVIGWNPGESNPANAIQQLWKETSLSAGTKYIDSRLMYFSDMDPQNSVVSIFNRKFFNYEYGNAEKLGAEICLWSDRRVLQEKDLLTTNPVYPDLLAFAERIWRGGGCDGHRFLIGENGSQQASDFEEFENRLLVHKQNYFQYLPFSYVKQTHIRWKLFGPFDNNGDLAQSFYPEQQNVSLQDSVAAINATGGTLWLRHSQWPEVKAWLPSPKDKTTWYAFTRFWSDSSAIIDFWIDFKDQSRSGADATPPANQWDYNQSRVWVNKEKIAPPVWKFPGRPSGLLEDPLVDEAHYYRSPHRVKVNKGWNEVLVKLPVNNFEIKDWQSPPKYMFTFIPVYKTSGINWETENFKFQPER